MEQLNFELTDAGVEPRGRYQVATSFLVSLVVHLILLLTFSSLWILGRPAEAIRLLADSETATQLEDLSVELELPQQEDALTVEVLQSPDPVLLDDLPPSLPDEVENVEPAEIGSDLIAVEPSAEPAGGESTRGSSSAGASFFGIPPVGDRIVYIIDMSSSMELGRYQRRFDRAVEEVINSVEQLRSDQEFFVIMFSFKTLKLRIAGNEEFCFPTEENKRRLRKRLYGLELSSGTDPREALVSALKLKPTCIYLLSDGEFNGVQLRNGVYRDKIDAYQLSLKHNKNKCPIHTIGLEDPRTQQQLTQISKASGGTYVFVPAEF